MTKLEKLEQKQAELNLVLNYDVCCLYGDAELIIFPNCEHKIRKEYDTVTEKIAKLEAKKAA